jgi:hypothetical protein
MFEAAMHAQGGEPTQSVFRVENYGSYVAPEVCCTH